nr:MAG TPA: hypothetical protein [Caudoviricetes sp.]
MENKEYTSQDLRRLQKLKNESVKKCKVALFEIIQYCIYLTAMVIFILQERKNHVVCCVSAIVAIFGLCCMAYNSKEFIRNLRNYHYMKKSYNEAAEYLGVK